MIRASRLARFSLLVACLMAPVVFCAACAARLASAAPAASASPAAADARARQVLERYIVALGGRAAVDAQHSVHVKGKVNAFGLTGTTEAWTERPDHSASVTQLGPFTLLEGFDGKTGWRTDPSGKLMILEGRDLERARASAWFENELYLDPDLGGGRATWAGSEKDSSGTDDVIEITPPAGQSRRFAFSPASGMLARETMKDDQQTVVSTLSDWRMAGTRRMAFVTHTQVLGMTANSLSVTVDSAEVNVAVPPSRFAPPAAAAAALRWLKQDGLARLPFEYHGRHVWLRASINGAPPADFLFDTGASICVLDSAYAASIGLATEGKMEAMGAGSSGGASFAKVKTLRVAGADGDGVELADQKVGVLSINSILAPFFWRDCAGVLGYSFISQFVDEIDFDHRLITLRDPAKFQYEGAGTKLAMTLAGTVPVVTMKLDGAIDGEFRLDVGSNSTVDIHGPFVKKHALDRTGGRRVEVMGAGFGGEFKNQLVRMKRIDIGPYGWDEPLVSLSGATTGALASEDYAGNVGNQILERFKCTLDYDHHAVYLEPGAQYATRDKFSTAGVLLVKVGDSIHAGQVLPGSAAAKAGMREGDEVTSIDGKPALSYDVDDLQRLFEDSTQGRTVPIEITREGKPRQLKMKLKTMI